MGIILGKFRKKPTTYETLEKLEKNINEIEEFRRDTERTHRKMVGRFVFISVCVYCITAFIFYFYFFPASVYERIMYIIPLLIMPILLIFLKRILSWYYSRQITKNETKLTNLKNEKKKILEEVMDKETYKVAQKILEKFAPEQIKKQNPPIVDRTPSKLPLSTMGGTGYDLRRRATIQNANTAATPFKSIQAAPQTPFPQKALNASIINNQTPLRSIVPSNTGVSTPLRLPRAILPRERSVLDKMVDYLVGDGPSNRYALICKKCFSHNGMALKEEFDYLSFRCCYCGTFNPSRKQRPAAPKLEMSDKSKPASKASSDESDEEVNNSEAEEKSDDLPLKDPLVTRGQSKRPDRQSDSYIAPNTGRRSTVEESLVTEKDLFDSVRSSVTSDGGEVESKPLVDTKKKTSGQQSVEEDKEGGEEKEESKVKEDKDKED